MSYNYITINNYFQNKNIPILDSESTLSSLSQKKAQTLTEIIEKFKNYPMDSLTAATITVKPNKNLSYYDQLYRIEKQLRVYDNDKSTKKTQYIGFHESTKGNLPHVHLLIYNAYHAPFSRAFGPLGEHNKNKLSFQKVKNIEKYIEYIKKEHIESNKYYQKVE